VYISRETRSRSTEQNHAAVSGEYPFWIKMGTEWRGAKTAAESGLETQKDGEGGFFFGISFE